MSCASQHPLGHVVKLQVAPSQTPPTHASPEGHVVQAAPPEPHRLRLVPAWQVPEASQQPVGQVVALHEEALQVPAVQLSLDGHAWQAVPPYPQSALVTPGWHLPVLSQHPVGHVVALQAAEVQAPLTQLSPDGQVAHAAPPVPQAADVLPASHRPDASQHPLGHDEALHGGGLQEPALQVSPAGHTLHMAPPVPQAPVVVPASQNPLASQQPVGHVAGPHAGPLQSPDEQESPGGQGRQAAPPVPHADVLVPDSHLPALSQQPEQLMLLQVVP